MTNPEEIVQIIRTDAMEDTNISRELGIKFFFHWALLSGAALTLLVPFLSSEIVQQNIISHLTPYIYTAITCFIVALIFSSIRNFIMMSAIRDRAQKNHNIANEFSRAIKSGSDYKTEEQKEQYILVLQVVEYIAIFSFIIGIVAAYIFISKVII